MSARRLTFVAAALVAVSAPSQAQLISNGSFETPVVPSASFQGFGTGSSFGGWTVVGASGNVAVVSGSFTQNGFNFPAQSGAQWLDLTGTSNTATGVQQTIATVIGSTYSLSFWVGNIVDPNGIFGTTSTVAVLVNGTALASATNTGAGSPTQAWQQFTRSFTATSTLTTLTFLNGDPSNDTSNGLDNIVLLGPTSTVPEPSAVGLLAIGLVGAAAQRRRMRRS